MMGKRYDGADHPPLPPLDIMIVGNTVTIGGAVDHDPVPILLLLLAVIATVTIAMLESIPKNQNENIKAKEVKNGVDHPANGKANIKVVTVGKKRRRKRSRNEVTIIIGRKGIDHHHHLNHHHHPTAAVGTMMMTTQTYEDLPFQVKRLKCTLIKRRMIWYGTRLGKIF